VKRLAVRVIKVSIASLKTFNIEEILSNGRDPRERRRRQPNHLKEKAKAKAKVNDTYTSHN
jgi:hypothetical protein